jgi:putative heme degradation protein
MKNRFRWHDDLGLGTKKSLPARESLLTEGIFAANIDGGTPGSIRVALWREWPAMLDDLRGVGPVWSIVRNHHCVLAVEDIIPKISVSSNGNWGWGSRHDHRIRCHFPSWRKAVAFDSGCRCGKTYGLETENMAGEIFHRVCMPTGNDLYAFAEWVQVHQATGLETEDEEQESMPMPALSKISHGRMRLSPLFLRIILITAAERGIPFLVEVNGKGMSQAARIAPSKAEETQGWLILSGDKRSLYVASEPYGSLLLDQAIINGEAAWSLSLVDPWGEHLLSLKPEPANRAAWNQLVQQFVFRPIG